MKIVPENRFKNIKLNFDRKMRSPKCEILLRRSLRVRSADTRHLEKHGGLVIRHFLTLYRAGRRQSANPVPPHLENNCERYHALRGLVGGQVDLVRLVDDDDLLVQRSAAVPRLGNLVGFCSHGFSDDKHLKFINSCYM